MKIDPYKSQETFEGWLARIDLDATKGLSKKNATLLVEFIKDFSIGLNISKLSKKGARSPIRLNHLRQKVMFTFLKLQERGVKDITKAKEEDLHQLFEDMRSGALPNKYGKPYLSTGDYIKDMKTFWHWHMKIEKKKGNEIKDITEDLSTRGEKPKFVYFTQEEFEKMVEKATIDLKPIMILAFSSGARPSELINIKVSDFSDDFKFLTIRDEISKTFGRKIKVILGHEQIKGYVEKFNLGRDSFIAKLSLSAINKELRTLGKKILPKDRIQFKNLSLLDFRHASCCFWLSIYKSENALKYKFGWKKSDKIHYYSEFLGMKDTINEDDLYIDVTKTELEKEIADLKEKSVSKEDVLKLVKELLNSYNINSRPTKTNDALEVFEN